MPVIINGTSGITDVDGTASAPALTGTDTDTGTFFPAANTMAWSTGGTERARVDSSGNVGIGTSSPTLTLNVKSPSDYRSALFETASTLGPSVQIKGSRIYELRSTNTGASEGGGLFFIYDKTAEASRLTVDSSGNVGIGIAPTGDTLLEIYGANSATIYKNVNTGTGSSDGFYVGMAKSSGTDGYVYNRESANLIFGTANTERARIDTSGNLLVGTTATTSNARLAVTTSSTSNLDYGIYAKNSGGAFLLGIDNDGGFATGTAAGSPYNATTASAANVFVASTGLLQRSTSSLKYKTDVQNATHGLSDVLKLRSVTYRGKTDGNTIFGGLIAEEVHEAGLTEFVQYAEDGTPDALAYGNMVSLCIKAIQEQQSIITQLTAAIQELKAELDATKAEVAALKGQA